MAKKTTGKTRTAKKKTGGHKPKGTTAREGKKLVIVESPAKARTIGRYLGSDYRVLASYGHVRDLPKTRSGVDIANDFAPTYVNLRERSRVIAELAQQARAASQVFMATDPDREGEAIAWHLQEALKLPEERVRRVTFNEITQRAIQQAFDSPGSIDMDRVNAQQARRILDRIVGYDLSELLWRKLWGGLSAGRVQSVAVRLVVEREAAIAAFVAHEYWRLRAQLEKAGLEFEAELTQIGLERLLSGEEVQKKREAEARAREAEARGEPGTAKIPPGTIIADERRAGEIVRDLDGKPLEVSGYQVREVKDWPLPPLATSQLQQQAASRLNFSAQKTMRLAQQLYEGIAVNGEQTALITYMRTDSFRVAPEAQQAAREVIRRRFGESYLPEKPPVYRARRGAQEAHEAIRPTDCALLPESLRDQLDRDQFRLYQLIWSRFLASQMVPGVYDQTTAELTATGHSGTAYVFRAAGRVLKFDGHLAAWDREEHLTPPNEETQGDKEDPASGGIDSGGLKRKERPIPAMSTGEMLLPKQLSPSQHFTQPPPRYNEASLVKTLEKEGIGRPSTYAEIITKIQERSYVEKKNGRFHATELGQTVTRKLIAHFSTEMDLGFTREVEEKLDGIEEQHLDWVQVLREFYARFSADLAEARQTMPHLSEEATPSAQLCPRCGAEMKRRLGRYGPYLQCATASCNTRLKLGEDGQPLGPSGPEPTGIVCPTCGKPMEKLTGRFGPYVRCTDTESCKTTASLNQEGQPLFRRKPTATTVPCPKCQQAMVLRFTRRRGGGAFLGCPRYPKCRGTRSLSKEVAQRLPRHADGPLSPADLGLDLAEEKNEQTASGTTAEKTDTAPGSLSP